MSDDQIYSKKINRIVDFAFNEQVAEVFADMLERSVPAYRQLIAMLGVFAESYYQKDSYCYDLGCSLGAASIAVANRLQSHEFNILAIDNSESMVRRCQQTVSSLGFEKQIKVELADICEVEINNASIVILNFTLQFISIDKRLALLSKIYSGLRSGGILILSEKCQSNDPSQQQFQENIYQEFKRANGYSELEIAQKREALDKVLLPESIQTHKGRLVKAGFGKVEQWFQCFQFFSFCAIKK